MTQYVFECDEITRCAECPMCARPRRASAPSYCAITNKAVAVSDVCDTDCPLVAFQTAWLKRLVAYLEGMAEVMRRTHTMKINVKASDGFLVETDVPYQAVMTAESIDDIARKLNRKIEGCQEALQDGGDEE